LPVARHVAAAACAILPALVGLACSRQVVAPHVENQRPVVRLTNAPTQPAARYDYAYRMQWAGFDPDGEIAYFAYALDPPAPSAVHPEPETTWVRTEDFSHEFSFTASSPDPVLPGVPASASDYHVFVIEAVDNRGLVSEPAISAFNSRTIAPQVSILSPVPNGPSRLFLSPTLTIEWKGVDPDGQNRQTPVFYRVKLLTSNTEVTPATALQYPDSVRTCYQPRGWATWDSLGGDVTSYRLVNLAPDQDYAFCVVAYDEAGAYSPVVSSNSNLLYFRAIYAQAGGPKLTLFNDTFSYTYRTSNYRPNDPTLEIPLEVSANAATDFNWTAQASTGAFVAYYRWVLDPEDIADNRPRTNERDDLRHWSRASASLTRASLPPQVITGDHHFYVEVADNNGLLALGHVHFQAIAANFDRELLIVDDTRFTLDARSLTASTCINRPSGRWPTVAELDTFLYARGGVPIKCYPAGSVSRPGIFLGYDFDTLNTRLGRADPTIPLSRLSHYRHVLWLVDATSAGNYASPDNQDAGMTTLRYMCQFGTANTLVSYLQLGGEVWLAGGGCVYASLMSRLEFGIPPIQGYSEQLGNLGPGTFAYDIAHWRVSVRRTAGALQFRRSLGRLESNPGVYAQLPASLQIKSLAAGDSIPAWRTTSDYYPQTLDAEAISGPVRLVEDLDPDPLQEDLQSTLDTLYTVTGGILTSAVAMTVYHGNENGRVITTGFNLWSFRSSQLRQLVDVVLQGVWGMSRHPVAPTRAGAPSAWAPAAAGNRR
jgi:hypothetical protein